MERNRKIQDIRMRRKRKGQVINYEARQASLQFSGMLVWERLEDEAGANFGEETLDYNFAEGGDRERSMRAGDNKGCDDFAEVLVVSVGIVDRYV